MAQNVFWFTCYRVLMYEREVAMVGDPVMAIRGIAYFVSQAVPT